MSGEPQLHEACFKVDREALRKRLSEEQFRVTQQSDTEMAFSGAFWNSKQSGTYRCVVCDQPLFQSETKFDSGTGWPSYFKAEDGAVSEHRDESHGTVRVEVKCKKCEAHLGHLFDDGPEVTGLRYCINSASLKFDERK